jgi:hypothetical protein
VRREEKSRVVGEHNAAQYLIFEKMSVRFNELIVTAATLLALSIDIASKARYGCPY